MPAVQKGADLQVARGGHIEGWDSAHFSVLCQRRLSSHRIFLVGELETAAP
jgi:hypothetical protein